MPLEPGHGTIVLIDPEHASQKRVSEILRDAGYRVESPDELNHREPTESPDAAIVRLDWRPGETAARVGRLKRRLAGAPMLVLVGPHRLNDAVEALQHGADDYFVDPPDPFELRMRVQRILDRRELDSRVAYFQNELLKKSVYRNLEANSPPMKAVVEKVQRVAPRRSTVLIYGESGVGKELVARSVHFNSPRRDRPFIALNCAAMPSSLIESELFGHERGSFTGAHARLRGKFEIAHRGTLFLDEIGEMDPNLQAKLLRVLEEKEFMRIGGSQSIRVDVRLIAATNAELEKLVEEGRFRSDLYYRLKVVTIPVPPLRERCDDIPHLVHTFVEELSRENAIPRKTVPPETMAALKEYRWPGNVRELKNFVESALVSLPGDVIRLEDLPRSIRKTEGALPRGGFTPGRTLAEMERDWIRATLEHTGGNRTHSALLLGIGIRTLQRKIQSYGIEIPSKRRRPRETA